MLPFLSSPVALVAEVLKPTTGLLMRPKTDERRRSRDAHVSVSAVVLVQSSRGSSEMTEEPEETAEPRPEIGVSDQTGYRDQDRTYGLDLWGVLEMLS